MSISGSLMKRLMKATLALLLVMMLWGCLAQQGAFSIGKPQGAAECIDLNHNNICDVEETAGQGAVVISPLVAESNRLNQVAEWPVDGVPSGIAVGPGGEVYVNINQNHKVVEYSSDGEKRAEFDVDGVIETNGIVVGTDRDVYIIMGDRLTRYNPSGEKLAEWPLDGLPNGLAAGPGGEVLVLVDNQVAVYGPERQRLKELEVEDGAGAIASGPDGSIYVAYLQRVVRYSPNGEMQEEWMVEGAMSVDGIAVDRRGEVYVNINQNYRVVRYTPAGERVSQWDLEGNFSDVAISSEGLIFAADVDAGSIRAFQTRA